MSCGRSHVGRLRISTVALVLGGLVLRGSVVSIVAVDWECILPPPSKGISLATSLTTSGRSWVIVQM